MTLKEQIANAKIALNDAQKTLWILEAKCRPHQYVKVGESARCDVCGNHGGWYCPSSPDHLCDYEHYDEEMGGHYVDYDCCIYCGDPEERK